MNKELLNILSNSNKDIDNQKLMDYLSGKLTPDERHELEMQITDSEMMNDAVEGLETFKDKRSVEAYVEQLNAGLQKNLSKKKNRREKRKLKDQPWLLMTIVILLVLIIICFIVIKKHLDSESNNQPTPVHTSRIVSDTHPGHYEL